MRLHSRFVPWDHSCGRCRSDWEQLFCSLFSSYRRWHCLHSGDGQRGTLLSLNSVCSLRVGTKSPQTPRNSTSTLGIGRERWGRRCQTEWDWWQDITRSWSHSHRTHGAINYRLWRLQWTQNIIIKCTNLLFLSVVVRSESGENHLNWQMDTIICRTYVYWGVVLHSSANWHTEQKFALLQRKGEKPKALKFKHNIQTAG